MATFTTFKNLLNTSDSIIEIIECGIEVDWSAGFKPESVESALMEPSIHDIICGLYWHCVENHSGQWSDTYKLQCILRHFYTPGDNESGPQEDTCSMNVYSQLNELAVK